MVAAVRSVGSFTARVFRNSRSPLIRVSSRPRIRLARSPFRNRWTDSAGKPWLGSSSLSTSSFKLARVGERLADLVTVEEHAVRGATKKFSEFLLDGRHVSHSPSTKGREQRTWIEVGRTSKRTRLKRRKVEQKGTYACASTIEAIRKRPSRCVEIYNVEPSPLAPSKVSDFA